MRRQRAIALAALSLLALVARSEGAGGDRFVLAWPPTRYDSAELILWRDVAGGDPLRVHVLARGIDASFDVPASLPLRVPLPPQAHCASGLDACAIEVVRVQGSAAFSVVLQSPDTNGAADTLLLTAHDTVRIPPAGAAPRSWRALSMPCAPPSEMPMTSSFVTIVPTTGDALVRTSATPCASAQSTSVPFGSALTIACGGDGDDLTGLAVEADAPVVALSGNAVTTAPIDPGRGLSGDLVLDLAATPAGAARFVVPPLPRASALAGGGDVVRVLALEDASVRIDDDRGGSRTVALAAGDGIDLDSAASGGDLTFALQADASIAAWQVPKSRLLRGLGDPAAIPVVPSTRFVRSDRVAQPDGYDEANVLIVAAEPGAHVTVDGAPIALSAAPGGALDVGVLALAPAPAGGVVHELAGDAPFGAWIAGFGGYKAYGHAAACAWSPPGCELRRGSRADALAPLASVGASPSSFTDADSSPSLFWSLSDDAALLRVGRCSDAACLTW